MLQSQREKLAYRVSRAKYEALGVKAAAEAAAGQLAQLESLLAAESRGDGTVADHSAKHLLTLASDHLGEVGKRLPDTGLYIGAAHGVFDETGQ